MKHKYDNKEIKVSCDEIYSYLQLNEMEECPHERYWNNMIISGYIANINEQLIKLHKKHSDWFDEKDILQGNETIKALQYHYPDFDWSEHFEIK